MCFSFREGVYHYLKEGKNGQYVEIIKHEQIYKNENIFKYRISRLAFIKNNESFFWDRGKIDCDAGGERPRVTA